MNVDFDIEKLQKVADDFYHATGIGIYIISSSFSDVKVKSTKWNPYCHAIRGAEGGRERCLASDEILLDRCRCSGKPELHVCHGGLVNIAAPILYENSTVGYVFFFSLREKPFSEVAKGISDLGLDVRKLEESYLNVPHYDKKRFDSVINLAVMLCEHVILSNMIKPSSNETLQRVKIFINSNLDKPLSVKTISKGANISKSVLYRLFSKHYGCAVSEYVNRKRIEQACEMLCATELSINEIARKVGYGSDVYFRLVFKKIKNITPLKFRKSKNDIKQIGEKK